MSQIRFGPSFPPLEHYENVVWKENEEHKVEFFAGKYFLVRLISIINPNLEKYLHELEEDDRIAMDLEWDDDLSLFQFCACDKVLIIRHPRGEGNSTLHNFLKTHRFYAKGIHNDKIKLKEKFGQTFQENIEDIAKTRLVPYRLSENFMKMTTQFAGTPTSVFKDVRITVSDWSESHELTARQILYAAFDVVALYQAYPNFPPPKSNSLKENSNKKQQRIENSGKTHEKNRKTIENSTINISKAVLKRNHSYPVHSYILSNYQGETDPFSLKQAFQECDKVSFYNGMLLLTSKNKLNLDGNFIELPQLNYKLFCDHDHYFIEKMPESLNLAKFNEFLYCFGEDHQVQNNGFIKVLIHNAQSCLLMKTFIPYIDFDGEKIELLNFPHFIPDLIGIFPPFSTLQQIQDFFENDEHLKNVIFMRLRTDNQPVKVILKFDSVENAERALSSYNYHFMNDFEVLLSKYADENSLRMMRDTQIRFKSTEFNSKQLYEKFSTYGRVFLASFDQRFQVGRIIFYEKESIQQCLDQEPLCSIPIEGSMAFIRNLPLTVTDEEIICLIGSNGHLIDYLFRDLDQFSRFSIVEATFETVEESVNLKKQYHHVKFKDMLLEVNCVNNEETEAPIWKMQERKQWIGIKTNNERDIDIYNQCISHGKVVNFKHIDENVYVQYVSADQARNAIQYLDLDVFSITVSDFTTIVDKEKFEIITTESIRRPTHIEQQTMVVIIDPMPESLTKAQLADFLSEIKDYEILTTKRVSTEGRRALIYTRSKKVMNQVYIKLEKILIDHQILNIYKRMPSDVIKPPRTIPFEPPPSRKMPIVVDPIPDSWNELKVYQLLLEAGKHSIKITGSAVESKKRRLIVEPRNTKAKVLCYQILNEQKDVVALRVSHEDLLPPIDPPSEEENEKYSDVIE